MGRQGDWRLKNACPCCMYQLQGEPDLRYSILSTMDGNDSLKRVERARRTRDHEGNIITSESIERTRLNFPNTYYLTPEQVDIYKDEVKGHSNNVRRFLFRNCFQL
jgi:hypothetical protein